MDYVSCTSNPSCGFTFGKIGDIAVVTELVLVHCVNKYISFKKKKQPFSQGYPTISHQFTLRIKSYRQGKRRGVFCTLPSLLSWRNAGGFSAAIPWSALRASCPACSPQRRGPSWCRAGGRRQASLLPSPAKAHTFRHVLSFPEG